MYFRRPDIFENHGCVFIQNTSGFNYIDHKQFNTGGHQNRSYFRWSLTSANSLSISRSPIIHILKCYIIWNEWRRSFKPSECFQFGDQHHENLQNTDTVPILNFSSTCNFDSSISKMVDFEKRYVNFSWDWWRISGQTREMLTSPTCTCPVHLSRYPGTLNRIVFYHWYQVLSTHYSLATYQLSPSHQSHQSSWPYSSV